MRGIPTKCDSVRFCRIMTMSLFCMYDVNILSGILAMDTLRSHPVAIVGGIVYENPFVASLDDFLAELRARRQ